MDSMVEQFVRLVVQRLQVDSTLARDLDRPALQATFRRAIDSLPEGKLRATLNTHYADAISLLYEFVLASYPYARARACVYVWRENGMGAKTEPADRSSTQTSTCLREWVSASARL